MLSSNGVEREINGETSIVDGAEVTVATEREELSLSLSQLDNGASVIFELPGFATAASGAQQSSLDALRAASGTSYYQSNDALWVKVVVETPAGGAGGGRGGFGGFGGGTSIQVSR